MRIWIIFFISLLLPVAATGQAKPVILKSEGAIYVGGATSTTTSMYVVGSAEFTSDAVDQTKLVLSGQMELTGDLVDDMIGASGLDKDELVDVADQGSILFSGKDVQQRIYRSTRSKNLLSDNHFIYIPNLYVRQPVLTSPTEKNKKNQRNVALDYLTAIRVGKLDIKNGNRFRVETSGLSSTGTLLYDQIKSGHLYLDQLEDDYTVDATRGYSEVMLDMSDEMAVRSALETKASGSPKRFLGFGSPFEELGADHMFFNVLTRPNPYSVTSYEGPIVDPKYKLTTGIGHFIAVDASDYDYTEIENEWTISRNNRARNEYQFSRYLINEFSVAGGSKDNFSQNAYGTIKERFNTADVSVELRPGLNFLANPFMAPIDLSPLLNDQDMGTESYNVSELGGVQVTRKTQPSGFGLRDRFWVVANSYVTESGGDFHYAISYYDVLPSAGTATLGNKGAVGNLGVSWDSRAYIAPMQMFVVQASDWGNITLTRNLQTFDVLGKSDIYIPKSTKDADDQNQLPDQILLQAEVVGESREDRTCIVFTDDSKFSSTDYLDNRKGLAESLESDEKSELSTLGGLIYTKATDGTKGVPMLTNSLPKSVKQLALYVYPTYTTQEMVIRPYRMESLKDIQRVWLEDRHEGKIIELTPETEYSFVSQPLTESQAQENRFVLYFNEMPENWGGDGQTADGEIVCYYKNTSINIIGLNEGDINSRVQVYDMQGRLIFSSIIKDAPKSAYLKALAQGTYIVKITGKRNFTSKFVSVDN